MYTLEEHKELKEVKGTRSNLCVFTDTLKAWGCSYQQKLLTVWEQGQTSSYWEAHLLVTWPVQQGTFDQSQNETAHLLEDPEENSVYPLKNIFMAIKWCQKKDTIFHTQEHQSNL